ncbi:DNA helicase Rep [Porticoccaceae bacterium]|nr:DNA helicase Rep [Porticoccaceae bacterium]MDB2566161.1 DNA helicase Rep [Porticoccaceae bacterium]MDB2620444.1 DNA helicase Rep [Porticoccaceae bacterium]MDB2669115.1 DNA helicase Rep [Porticoccaceae bacterium]
MATTLNIQQQAALKYIDGPLLVLAGAGSGKTSVITQKIAYLVEQCEIPAYSIAAVTFTNKAAREMKARVNGFIAKDKAKGLTVSTFHNLGLNIIRTEIKTLGFKPGFSILDQEDCRNLLKELMVRHSELDDKLIDTIQNTISNWKNSLLEPGQAVNTANSTGEQGIAMLYERYQRALKAYNAVDFDDLIMIPVMLFRHFPEVLNKWQRKIRYLLVDEYQDTNLAQYELIKTLVNEKQALTVVGDDDQSIYAWRGARPENLMQLQEDFPDLEVIKLEQNYRSTGRILRAANTLIDNNPHLINKVLWSELGPGDPLRFISSENEDSECERVVNEIIDMRLKRRCKYSNFAILYRGNYQAKLVEIKLQAQNIPYEITGGQSFYAKTEIKDVMAYLRLLVNPDDDNALLRIINTPRRQIGPTTLEKLGGYANKRGLSLYDTIDEVGLSASMPTNNLQRLKDFKRWIEQARKNVYSGNSIAAINEMLSDADYLGWLHQNASSDHVAQKRWDNVNFLLAQLTQVLKNDQTDTSDIDGDSAIENAIAKLILRDILDREEEESADDKVQLLTLHAAKGLEFLHVFMIGMEEDILPHRNSVEGGQIEEERRLAYVGITRAQRTLTMTSARQRTQFGETSATTPSRFVDELPEDDLIKIGGNTETDAAENQAKGEESLAALKSLFG